MNQTSPDVMETMNPRVEAEETTQEQSAEEPKSSIVERKLDVRGQGTERYVALKNGQTDVPVEYVTSRSLITEYDSELTDRSVEVSEIVEKLLEEGKREEAEELMRTELEGQHEKGQEADVMSRSIRRIAIELGISNIMRVKPGSLEKPSIDTTKLGANGSTIVEAATAGNVFVVPDGLNEQIKHVFKEESAKAISQSDVRYRSQMDTDATYDSSDNYFRVLLETNQDHPIELFFLIGHEDQNTVQAEQKAEDNSSTVERKAA